MKIRDDKDWYETLNYEELLKCFDSSAKNSHIIKNKRKIEEIDANEVLNKQKNNKNKAEKYNKVLDNFKDTDTENVLK